MFKSFIDIVNWTYKQWYRCRDCNRLIKVENLDGGFYYHCPICLMTGCVFHPCKIKYFFKI